MRCPRRLLGPAASVLLLVTAWPAAGEASTHAELGRPIDAPALPDVDGGTRPVIARDARANVFVFVRPGQDHSAEALRMLAQCERELAGKAVHWVAIVSGAFARDEARAFVRAAGARMPVLVDDGDRLYGALGVRLHPSIGIADGEARLVAFEPFRKVQYCDVVRARVRQALGEIDAAEAERAVRPEKAVLPGDVKGAPANRHVKLGDALARKGDCAAAEKAYDEALRSDPANEKALEGKRRCAAGAR